MTLGELICGSRIWVKVDTGGIPTARGLLAPRLVIPLRFTTPSERVEAELRTVRLQVTYDGEVIGEALVIGEPVLRGGTPYHCEVPVTHAALEYITGRLTGTASVTLDLHWNGQLAVTWHCNEQDPRTMSDPEPGVETLLTLGHSAARSLHIARSDWFTHVLTPTRHEDYLFLEVAVPRGAAAAGWTNAYAALRKAEESYALGDDAAAFNHLRGSLDALPGAKQHILDGLAEPRRGELDKLTKAIGNYFHAGRHVSKEGPAAGTFPVDHQDAGFAIHLMKTLLSHLSQVLPVTAAAEDTNPSPVS